MLLHTQRRPRPAAPRPAGCPIMPWGVTAAMQHSAVQANTDEAGPGPIPGPPPHTHQPSPARTCWMVVGSDAYTAVTNAASRRSTDTSCCRLASGCGQRPSCSALIASRDGPQSSGSVATRTAASSRGSTGDAPLAARPLPPPAAAGPSTSAVSASPCEAASAARDFRRYTRKAGPTAAACAPSATPAPAPAGLAAAASPCPSCCPCTPPKPSLERIASCHGRSSGWPSWRVLPPTSSTRL